MRLIRPFAIALTVSIVAAACSSAGDGTVAEPATPSPVVTASTATPAPTSVPSSTPESIQAVDVEAAIAAWLGVWDGAELLVSEPVAAEQAILAAADQAVFEQLDTIYNPAVGSDVANSPRTFEQSPVAEEQADGSVVINDCMFETPRAGNATIWYFGRAELVGGAWLITAVSLESEIGCVPASMAADAIAGYEAYWDARVEFWDPADPSNALIEETTTGVHLELIEGLLADHADRGLALRGRAMTRPEIIEVRSATQVAILDCSEQDAGRGLFVVETGERLDDIPVVADGQRDLTSAVMVLEGGAWKVSDIQGQADVSCDAAPTNQGLPVV